MYAKSYILSDVHRSWLFNWMRSYDDGINVSDSGNGSVCSVIQALINEETSTLGVGKNIDSAMHRDSFPCISISIQQSSESIQAPGQWGAL